MSLSSQPLRTLISYTIIFLFLVCLLWSGIRNGLHTSIREAFGDLSSERLDFKGFPDFGQYVPLRTISADELSLDHRRLIIIGDIHGMKSSLDTLLSKLSYKPSDFLMHLGDIIAKGPSSLQILSQFSDANITGVRGNHEQKVIEWRGWIEWVEGQPGGTEWLANLERTSSQGVDASKKKHKHRRQWPIPKGWKFMADHYRIARSMSASQYSYLKSLPLVIHLPSLHTHLVHAGILPFNPMYSPTSSEQPLAHIPKASSPSPPTPTRTAQERALLTDIVQNTNPWVLLNMRSILDNAEVSRESKKGTPWSDLWNMTMERCQGYHLQEPPGEVDRQSDLNAAASGLSCLPINVIYGHAAARGLDIKRWSFGLDTGCVKGHDLTAMVVTNPNTSATVPDAQSPEMPFGENGKARLVSVPCSPS